MVHVTVLVLCLSGYHNHQISIQLGTCETKFENPSGSWIQSHKNLTQLDSIFHHAWCLSDTSHLVE